ncbi:hypothetical protein Tco_1239198 [Tanacetum coccineum]
MLRSRVSAIVGVRHYPDFVPTYNWSGTFETGIRPPAFSPIDLSPVGQDFFFLSGHGGGRAVLDFESSDVLMPSMNGGNQPMNLSSGSANTYNDRCQQTEVDNMLGQQCQNFASKKRRRNVNAQQLVNVISQDHSRKDILANRMRRSGVKRRYGKRRVTNKHVMDHPAVTEDIGSNNALPKGVSSLYMDIDDFQ